MTESIIATTRVKHDLQVGKLVLGTMVAEIRQASIMQLLANAALIFVLSTMSTAPLA